MAKTNPDTGLNDQQQRFADEYLLDFNASAAYHRAGYKAKGNAAEVGASKLLVNPRLQAYLKTRKAAMQAKLHVDQETVLARLIALTFADSRQLFDARGNLKPIHELTEEQAATIAGIEIREEYVMVGSGKERTREFDGYTKKVKFVNPLDSVRLLGQHFGLFAKKHEHSGPGGGPIAHSHDAVGQLLDLVDGADTGTGPAASRG